MAKIPNYVIAALNRRVRAAGMLTSATKVLEDYCRKIGMNVTESLDTAALGSSWMVLTEPEAARRMTLTSIKKALDEKAERQNTQRKSQHIQIEGTER